MGSGGMGAWTCLKTNMSAIADMWGPVVIDPKDTFYCSCENATNNAPGN